jgi:hypothetical protein
MGVNDIELHRAYFSPGSVSRCLTVDDIAVFAGGVVNMQWKRGEAWMLPTPWFKQHVKTSLRAMRDMLPQMVAEGGYKRVQVTCATHVSVLLFKHLGFAYEGMLCAFGPNGETCYMYSRLF